MSLEKLQIENLDHGKSFQVLFNPSQYSISYGNTWNEQEVVGNKPNLQFQAQKLRTISMDLFLDTYEKNTDVRDYIDDIANLLSSSTDSGTGDRPPILRLSWGGNHNDVSGFPEHCVLESLKQQITLFTSAGLPVRAKLSVTFKEWRDQDWDELFSPTNNSFPERIHISEPGDSLSGLAGRFWKDPTLWRLIAEENDIDNPRPLSAGRTLDIPAIL